jgi:hypothetical protein
MSLQTISKAKENMAFVLPCADTAIDTRLRICIAPSPSLSAGNTAVTAPTSGGLVGIENPITHEVEECVLTMASCWEHDNKGFLRGKVAMLENDIYTKATKLLGTAPWNKLHSLIDELEDIGCLCVAGCGHKFSGVPLLYTVLTSGFKCPICRFGGNAHIGICSAISKDCLKKVWEVMCIVCNVVLRRDLIEKNHDANFSTLQLARQTITMVYQTLPWVMRFVLYKEACPVMDSVPFAQIQMQLSVDRSALDRRHGVWPAMIELSAGARGSSARNLSKQMRASGSYFVELIFDIETARHVIFQSHKINHKSAPAPGQPRTCPHTEHTIGECDIFFEKCVYRNENFFKRVSYNVQETQLRAMIIGIAGLT